MDIQIYSDSAGRVPLVQWLEALADRQAIEYLDDWKQRG